MKRFGLPLLAFVLAGCGAQAAASGAATPTPTVSGSNGPFHAVAAPSRLRAGGTVHLTLTVTGPVQYETGCPQTLRIWADDGAHQQIWTEPQPMIACMAIAYKSLAAGERATFKADWPTASDLKSGSYTLHGLFLTVLPLGAGARMRENLPPLTIQISG